MSEYRVPYGKTTLTVQIPDRYRAELLAPAPIPPAPDPTKAVCDALDEPVGGVRLSDLARAKSVAIAVNDKTRPVPLAVLLPPLMQRLAALGIPNDAITFIIAVGTHAPMPREEFVDIIPAEILGRYRVISHDCNDSENLIHLGETSRGTPVSVNRTYMQADLRIVVGNLEPHQFMGFSGGVKTAAIGLGGKEMVNRNHSLMMDPRSNIARYKDNPMRMEVEEIGKMMGVHLSLNSLINEEHELIWVVAGEPRAVMQHGIPLVLRLYEVRVPEPFDLIISSPGGHPKDINLYQAQKGLAHATFVTKQGGTVVLVAACPEGVGSKAYEEWMKDKTSHAQVIETFKREGFRLGAHKGFQISRDASRERVLFVTEMANDFVRRFLLTPFSTLDNALQVALRGLPPNARIGIMPYANATIPVIPDL